MAYFRCLAAVPVTEKHWASITGSYVAGWNTTVFDLNRTKSFFATRDETHFNASVTELNIATDHYQHISLSNRHCRSGNDHRNAFGTAGFGRWLQKLYNKNLHENRDSLERLKSPRHWYTVHVETCEVDHSFGERRLHLKNPEKMRFLPCFAIPNAKFKTARFSKSAPGPN